MDLGHADGFAPARVAVLLEAFAQLDDDLEKSHGRIETRIVTVSGCVDWTVSDRSYPGQPRFAGIASVVKVFGQRRPRTLGRREHALAPRRRVQG